jgi:hypothetical protein
MESSSKGNAAGHLTLVGCCWVTEPHRCPICTAVNIQHILIRPGCMKGSSKGCAAGHFTPLYGCCCITLQQAADIVSLLSTDDV